MVPNSPVTAEWIDALLRVPAPEQQLERLRTAHLIDADGLSQVLDQAMQRARSDPAQARQLAILCAEAAEEANAPIIGVNNRDLRTFAVDLETSLRLIPRVPPLVTAVAESGLSDPADLARLRSIRCDAVLIGEALMTSPDPAAQLASLAAAARG